MGFTYGVRPIWQLQPTAVDMLRECIALRMSASETAAKMAEKFGVPITSNTVIGKANRIGLRFDSGKGGGARPGAGRPKGKDTGIPLSICQRSKPKPEKRHKTVFYFRPEQAGPVAGLPPEPIAIPVSRRVQLLELTFNSCRWPLGDPRHADFAFCGADRVKPEDESNAYCAYHAVVAYTPRPTRQITPEHRRAMLAGKSKAKRQREASWPE